MGSKNQRPELWNLFNGRKRIGDTLGIPYLKLDRNGRMAYVLHENIELLPCIFLIKEVVDRDGVLLGKCDYITLKEGEKWEEKTVRCRTIGDMTCTGVSESKLKL